MRLRIPSLKTIIACLIVRRFYWRKKFLWLPKFEDHATVHWLCWVGVRRQGDLVDNWVEYDFYPPKRYPYPGPKISDYFMYKSKTAPNPPTLP